MSSSNTAATSKKPTLHHVVDSDQYPSPLRDVLTDARHDLWRAQPLLLYLVFNALRDFVFDPALAISCVLLPPLFITRSNVDKTLATILKYAIFLPMKTVY